MTTHPCGQDKTTRAIKSLGGVELLLTILAPHSFARQPFLAEEEEAAIRALVQKTEQTNNAGDVDGWVSLFADDAGYMAPGAPPVTTREGLMKVAKAGFRHEAAIEIEPVEIKLFGAGRWRERTYRAP